MIRRWVSVRWVARFPSAYFLGNLARPRNILTFDYNQYSIRRPSPSRPVIVEDRMLAVIENTVEIARTPEAVFDNLSDQGNELHWNPDCVSMEKLTTGPVDVGTRFRAKWKQGPAVETECTRFERPRMWRTRTVGRSTSRSPSRSSRHRRVEQG